MTPTSQWFRAVAGHAEVGIFLTKTQGVSTRKVAAIVEQLCGCSVSSTQVSHCAAQLDVELEAWRTRPLGLYPFVLLDARYEKVRQGGRVIDCAVLIALGIGPDGKRSIFGVSAALSEAEVHWRSFLTSLQKRGRHGVQLLVSDDHAGLGAARAPVFPAVLWQRCQFHLQQNAQAYVPRLDQRAAVAQAVRSVFNSPALRKLSPPMPTPPPSWPFGWKKTSRKDWPSLPCRRPNNAACAPPTPWNAST